MSNISYVNKSIIYDDSLYYMSNISYVVKYFVAALRITSSRFAFLVIQREIVACWRVRKFSLHLQIIACTSHTLTASPYRNSVKL